MTGSHLDELARSLALPRSRRSALRLLGGTLVAAGTSGLLPSRALAGGGDPCPTCADRPGTLPCCARFGNGLAHVAIGQCYDPGTQQCCIGPSSVDGTPTAWICSKCDTCGADGAQLCVDGPPESKCGDSCGCPADKPYCCDRILTFKSPYCCDGKEYDKEAFKDGKYAENLVAIAFGIAAVLTTDGIAIALGIAGGINAAAGLGYDIAADDPPDPDYQGLFTPTIPRVRVRPGKSLTPSAARAFNKLIANALRSSAYQFAWVRSIEKAQGAEQAGDSEWVQRHRDAAASYARKAADALAGDMTLRAAARRQLKRSGFRHFKLTASQVRHWQRQVKQKGLPKEMKRVIRKARLDEGSIAKLQSDLVAIDAQDVARLGVFGEVKDQRFHDLNARLVTVLRGSADSLSAGGPLVV
jgi:hypothetical protein